ncbi:calmodulin calcium-dependent NAD kinase [Silene latifolia]|uniref:calmodulin calcium-dependent NAD kinase n=1 Tax=Silene latifolia TaxID=37657 RepID=UPI003D77B1A1
MDQKIVPQINRTESGRVGRLERFSHYVARQIGFEDPNECPQLCKLANDYLKKTEGCESNIFDFLANESDAESLYVDFIEEIDRCILSYFSFNWSQTSLMINQVLSKEDVERKTKLKDLVMAATRKQRFDRVLRNLKVVRVFSTLVEEMRAIGVSNGDGETKCTEVMVPMAHNKRSPVLLLMGGGMGAGKSTVLKDILKEPFWSGVAANAVRVEADAFKETDVIYRALSLSGHHADMLQTAELVHQSSTDAASSLLVTALNEGRDVIMDGTLSWAPFVEQTLEMARNVHKWRYRMGIGYKVAEDGSTIENYWERVGDDDPDEKSEQEKDRKPYRIELVGVVCDAYLAVVRGIRRAVMVKRAVRVKSQLNSHKRFASCFRQYSQLVDNARLYCTNTVGGPPMLIGWKDGYSRLLVDVDEIKCLSILSEINDEAESIYELHKDQSPLTHPGSAWKDLVMSLSRPNIQINLKSAIRKCELVT